MECDNEKFGPTLDLGISLYLRNTQYPNHGDITPDWCSWYNDTILCWPPTPPDSQASIPCSLISDLGSPCHPGLATLHCGQGGVWSLNTNYTECLANINLDRDRGLLPVIVAYTYFCLSVISLLFLLVCMYIFCSFRSLSCPRLTVHKHLMVSFILFYLSIIIYLEPYISFREGLDYRDIVSSLRGMVSTLSLEMFQPWLCKSLLILQVYSQMAAANW